MPKVQNTFLKGKMDSDTNYSLIRNDTYIRADIVTGKEMMELLKHLKEAN